MSVKDQSFTITLMMEDFPMGKPSVVNFDELMIKVSAYNKGTLAHCDAWFKIHDQNDVELSIQDFYQYL